MVYEGDPSSGVSSGGEYPLAVGGGVSRLTGGKCTSIVNCVVRSTAAGLCP